MVRIEDLNNIHFSGISRAFLANEQLKKNNTNHQGSLPSASFLDDFSFIVTSILQIVFRSH